MQYSTFFKEPLFTGKICTGFFCPYFSDILHTIWKHQEKFQNLVISRIFYRLSKRREKFERVSDRWLFAKALKISYH